ncbi:MAG: hypothetical protein V1798_10210 [Pseudomonadota bacterium]
MTKGRPFLFLILGIPMSISSTVEAQSSTAITGQIVSNYGCVVRAYWANGNQSIRPATLIPGNVDSQGIIATRLREGPINQTMLTTRFGQAPNGVEIQFGIFNHNKLLDRYDNRPAVIQTLNPLPTHFSVQFYGEHEDSYTLDCDQRSTHRGSP